MKFSPWPFLLSFELCALSFLLAGCSRPETRVEIGNRERILHLGNGAEPQGLDPQTSKGVGEHHIIMALLEGLVTEDPKDLHPVPGVAERWDISPDGLVYTFHLRHNARWSSGDPVTARDFLRSYQRILTRSLAAEYASAHYVVKNAEAYHSGTLTNFHEVGYKALDDHTFEITLHHATPYLLAAMNHTSWFPVHLPTVEKHGPAYARGNRWTRVENFVGNGPFVLARWHLNYVIQLQRSPTYWDATNVWLNQIHFHPIESADTEERAFRAGQLHVTEYMLPQKIAVYRRERPDCLQINPYLSTYFYRINTTKPPLNDRRVRRALAMAIDRQSIVDNVSRGGQRPAFHLTPPDTAGYTARARLTENLEAARKLLADAGYPEGRGLPPIEILYNTQETHRSLAEAIQQMWKKNLGVEARLLNQEWKVYLSAQRTLNYQVARAGWTGDYPDPNTFLETFTTGSGNNETGWSNPEYDRLVAEAGRTGDPSARYELFQQAEALLMEDMPILPIYFYTRVRLQRPEVKGWYPTLLDQHPYKYVYLEATKGNDR